MGKIQLKNPKQIVQFYLLLWIFKKINCFIYLVIYLFFYLFVYLFILELNWIELNLLIKTHYLFFNYLFILELNWIELNWIYLLCIVRCKIFVNHHTWIKICNFSFCMLFLTDNSISRGQGDYPSSTAVQAGHLP